MLRDSVQKLVQDRMVAMESFLVDLKVSSSNHIHVLFDSYRGVRLDDCVELSRYLEDNLDRDKEDYQLTVCSPGIDKEFLVDDQYIKNIGKDIHVKTICGDQFVARLVEYGEILVLDKYVKTYNKKQDVSERIKVPLRKIKEVKLVIKFK